MTLVIISYIQFFITSIHSIMNHPSTMKTLLSITWVTFVKCALFIYSSSIVMDGSFLAAVSVQLLAEIGEKRRFPRESFCPGHNNSMKKKVLSFEAPSRLNLHTYTEEEEAYTCWY
jgi:hypothetical protein